MIYQQGNVAITSSPNIKCCGLWIPIVLLEKPLNIQQNWVHKDVTAIDIDGYSFYHQKTSSKSFRIKSSTNTKLYLKYAPHHVKISRERPVNNTMIKLCF